MTRELVLVHGRSQQGKNPDELKQEWLEALAVGLAKNKPPLPPVDADRVRFPFYGDALDQMARGKSPDESADVVLKGDGPDDDSAKRFLLSVFDEIRAEYGITDHAVEISAGARYTEKGPLNWQWVRAILHKLDTVPELSAATIALATYDVYQYMSNRLIQRKIDTGVRQAMTPGAESVVVGHSLGSIVAYTILLREGRADHGDGRLKWKVPLLVTVGSPLAVTAIRNLAPGLGDVGGNRIPSCVSAWFNAMDPRDAVALYPLDPQHFFINPRNPAIENWSAVDNFTSNRHGIQGYLSDPVVAQRIYAALNPAEAPKSE